MSECETTGEKVVFTIGDAIAEYKAKKCREDGIGHLADWLSKLDLDLPDFPNDSYSDALTLTETMLRNTHHQFMILTGGACGGFYITLLEHLTGALNRIQKVGGKGRMIVMSHQYPEWLKALVEDFNGTFEIACVNSNQREKHFIVCDSKMVREEELHGELTLSSKADLVKAKVNFNEPSKGKYLESLFESIWSAPATDKSIPQRKTKAPSWLVYQMEASRHQPSPTSATAEKQFRSVEAARQTCAHSSKG